MTTLMLNDADRRTAVEVRDLLVSVLPARARTGRQVAGLPFALAQVNTVIREYDAGKATYAAWCDALDFAFAELEACREYDDQPGLEVLRCLWRALGAPTAKETNTLKYMSDVELARLLRDLEAF